MVIAKFRLSCCVRMLFVVNSRCVCGNPFASGSRSESASTAHHPENHEAVDSTWLGDCPDLGCKSVLCAQLWTMGRSRETANILRIETVLDNHESSKIKLSTEIH